MRRFMYLLVLALVCASSFATAQPVAAAAQSSSTLATYQQAVLLTSNTVTCSPQSAIDQAIAYIRTQQQPDGSFPSIGASSTADAVFSLVAAGIDVESVTNNGNSAIDYIYSQTDNLNGNVGVTAKFLLALVVSGASTVAPDGFDFVDAVQSAYDPQTGLYSTDVTSNAYALLALATAHERVPRKAVRALRELQNPDGGYYFNAAFGTQSDTNTTAIAVLALVANGGSGGTINRAVDYFRNQQSDDGGFPFSQVSDGDHGTASDTNSTALSILALVAAGEDLSGFVRNGNDPVERLLSLQNPSGAFRYNDTFTGDNAFATFQAVPALAATLCES